MSPQNGPHIAATLLIQAALASVFQSGWVILVQMPLVLDTGSKPEPDLAVVRGEPRDFVPGPPTTAELVVEVADTTLAFDLGRKAELYARAGIPEYWVLNLLDRVLVVHRRPDCSTGGFDEITRLAETALVSPLAAPTAAIPVRDLLP